MTLTCGLAIGLTLVALPLVAQESAPATAPAHAGMPNRPRDIQLVFEREVFHYQASARRDPFRSLATEAGEMPLFDDLKLRMIIYQEPPGQSVALIIDGTRKVHRLRKGDVIGNATVTGITANEVHFVVEDFGNRRQEVLNLKQQNPKEGA